MSTQRIAPADVLAIYPTEMDLQPFILTATLLVTERLVGHYTEARLTEIERWLTAHLASTSSSGSSTGSSGQVSSVRAEEITISYATGTLGEGLASSRYGEHVQMLDYLGLLTHDMTSKPAKFSVH